tara:strand:+ start:3280 stop:4077 length:798 start_codon:yes stop_codon:yes gene_type:complete
LNLSGRAIVVTGGTTGVGRATAILFAKSGARAIAICGRNEGKGARVVNELLDLGADAIFIRADLADPDDCYQVIDRAAEKFGTLDSLINCTGSTGRGTLEDTSVELWNHLFNVNTRAPFLLSQRIVPHLRSQGGGTIVNIGSVAAHSGQPYIMAYSAAKAALLTLTKNMANSLKWDRIRVNALNIGWTATPTEHDLQSNFHGMGENWLEKVASSQPFGRLMNPEDIAKGLGFLASSDSGVMTGAIVDFDQHVVGGVDENPLPKVN